jgi:hypothetical protein
MTINDEQFCDAYVSHQYDFLTKLGYDLVKTINNSSQHDVVNVQFLPHDDIIQNKKLYQVWTKEQLLQYSKEHKQCSFFEAFYFSDDSKNDYIFSCCIEFFCKNPAYRDRLIEHNARFLYQHEELVNQLINSNCDVLQVLLDISTDHFYIHLDSGINLTKLSESLKQHHFSQEQLHQFWIDFLTMRSNQINHLSSVHNVTNFLKNEYNQEQLEPFFDFIPFLKSQFYDVPLDIYEFTDTYTVSFVVNLYKIQKALCIEQWQLDTYKFTIKLLVEECSNHFKCSQCTIYPHLNNNDLLNIYFTHSDEKLSEAMLKHSINGFLNELRKNPKMEVTPENIRRFLLYQQMESDVNTKNNQNNQSLSHCVRKKI